MRSTSLRNELVKEYRTAEDYRRYGWGNVKRRRMLAKIFRKNRHYFGKKVLDLGCGGGVLGAIIEPTGRYYIGVDGNPDMINLARREAEERGSKQQFLSGNFCKMKISGQFDTLTLIGNTMGHLAIRDMEELLKTRRANVHRESTFLIDYRDLVAMFYRGTWRRVQVQTFVRGRIVHRTRTVDLRKGKLVMRARPSKDSWVLNWAHAIWSPFILESLMRSYGWRLESRSPARPGLAEDSLPEYDFDVYRFDPN
jgi:SAM-dependent methyltransferase